MKNIVTLKHVTTAMIPHFPCMIKWCSHS